MNWLFENSSIDRKESKEIIRKAINNGTMYDEEIFIGQQLCTILEEFVDFFFVFLSFVPTAAQSHKFLRWHGASVTMCH